MTADRARGALAVLQDADGKFICEVPCGYIVEQTASAHKPRRIQAQRRRRAMLRRRVALTVALLTVAALLAALMPWSGSGAADKPKDTTAGTLEEVHQPTAVLLPSSGTVAGYVPNAAEIEALAKLIYGEAGIVPSTTEQAAVVWCVLNRVDDPRFPDTVLEVNPFWREETETREDIATWIGGFEFPVPDGLELYDGWEIGYRQPSLIVNVYNSGDVKSGIRIEFRAIGAVTNPVLLNVDTREFIKLNISLVAGDVLTVSTGYGEKAVKLNRGGTITDAFRYLDVDSSYLQIAVGDNLFRYSADANAENLEVSIYHNNLYLGV